MVVYLIGECDPLESSKSGTFYSGFYDDLISRNYTGFETPTAYRRTILDYDYSLAKNTPNSSAVDGKGRLTLKSVAIAAGIGSEEVIMPPYSFAYQGSNVVYGGFEDADAWGFKKGDNFSNNMTGVNWNLSRVGFPSGGVLDIEYERDKLTQSVAGTLYKMCLEYPAQTKKGYDWSSRGIGRNGSDLTLGSENPYYYSNGTVVSFTDNTVAIILPNNEVPKQGMYCILTSQVQEEQTYRSLYNSKGIFTVTSVVHPIGTNTYTLTLDKSINGSVDLTPRISDFSPTGILLLRSHDLYCDGIRTRSLTLTGMSEKRTTTYTYGLASYTPSLPQGAIPWNIQFVYGFPYFISSFRWSDDYRKDVVATPFSSNPAENMNTGSMTVMYPMVGVNQINEGSTNMIGRLNYSFYIPGDNVIVNGISKPIVEQTESSVLYGLNGKRTKLHSVIDRSGIIGSPKRVEMLDKDGNIKKATDYIYSFSEDVHSKAGVCTEAGSRISSTNKQYPLGMVREREIRNSYGNTTDPIQSINDIIVSKPILTSTIDVVDGVKTITSQGLFYALTGAPLATLVKQEGVQNGSGKISMNIPWVLADIDAESDMAREITRKNRYTLNGISIVAEGNTIPNSVDDFISLQTTSWTNYTKNYFSSANGSQYVVESFPATADVRYNQARVYKQADYVWRGGTFNLFSDNVPGSGWKRVSSVTQVDGYTRPLSEVNAADEITTVSYHNRLNLITASYRNANRQESGAYTCDYQDGVTTNLGYLDYANGWGKGAYKQDGSLTDPSVVSVCEEAKHFGKKGVKITNAFGPSRSFKLQKGRDYIATAWVKSVEGNVPFVNDRIMGVSYRKLNSGTTEKWPLELSSITEAPCNSVVTASSGNGWRLVKMVIPASTDLAVSNGTSSYWDAGYQYATFWVGVPYGNGSNGKATVYVDDIRFYPKTSLVETYYYDQELAVPIAIVDANDKCRSFEYDVFGRLTKKKDNKGNLLAGAEYHQMTELKLGQNVLLLTPNDGASLNVSEKVRISWVSRTSGNITLSLADNDGVGRLFIALLENQAKGYGSYDWTVPPAALGAAMKVQIFNSTNNRDFSDETFSVNNSDCFPTTALYHCDFSSSDFSSKHFVQGATMSSSEGYCQLGCDKLLSWSFPSLSLPATSIQNKMVVIVGYVKPQSTSTNVKQRYDVCFRYRKTGASETLSYVTKYATEGWTKFEFAINLENTPLDYISLQINNNVDVIGPIVPLFIDDVTVYQQ